MFFQSFSYPLDSTPEEPIARWRILVLFRKSIKIFSKLAGKVGWKHRMSPAVFGLLAVSAASATRTVFLVLFSIIFRCQMSP